MNFFFIALCLSVSAKAATAALTNIDELHQFKQTISKFQAVVEKVIDKGDHEQLERILSSSETTTAERIWFCSKYWKTSWDINSGSTTFEDSVNNIPSITIADNPESLSVETLYVCEKVEEPINLAKYDAVNILMTLPYMSEFDAIDLQNLGAVKITELLNRRKEHGFDPDVITKAKDTKTLQNYIDKKLWKPTRLMIRDAIYRSQEYLLLLLKTEEGIPRPREFSLLIEKNNQVALDCFRKFHPDWKPSQHEIDTAFINGYTGVLEFYFSVDPAMALPSPFALIEAAASGHNPVVEWSIELVNSRNEHKFDPAVKTKAKNTEALQNPTDKQIEKPTGEMFKNENVIDLSLSLRGAQMAPSPHDLNTWIKEGDSKSIDRFRSHFPEWKPSQHEIDTAFINGYKSVLEFYLAVDPAMPLPNPFAVIEAAASGHNPVVEWSIELVKSRNEYKFDPAVKTKAKNTEALQNPTDKQIEKPTGEMLKDQSESNSQIGLEYFQRLAQGTPSPHDLNTWIENENSAAIDHFRLYCPEWKPSQRDIDIAFVNGYKGVLEFYLSVDPAMALPSPFTVLEALKRNHAHIIQWNIELMKKRAK